MTSYDNDLDRRIEPQTAVGWQPARRAATPQPATQGRPLPKGVEPTGRTARCQCARACNKLLTHAAQSEIRQEELTSVNKTSETTIKHTHTNVAGQLHRNSREKSRQ